MVKIKITNIDNGVEYETQTNNLKQYFKENHRLIGIKSSAEIDFIVNKFDRTGYVQIPYTLFGFDMVISCMQIKN